MGTRTTLGRVRGLGAAKDGVAHWWAQRLTALALVPLSIWFVVSIVSLIGADQVTVADWVASPLSAVLLILLSVAVFHHAQLGLQVVIEDYVHHEGLKIASLILIKLAAFALATAMAFSILLIALGV